MREVYQSLQKQENVATVFTVTAEERAGKLATHGRHSKQQQID